MAAHDGVRDQFCDDDDDDDQYYDIDEDQILSGLSAQELEQLENELDRDLFNAPSHRHHDEDDRYNRGRNSKFRTVGYSIDEKDEDQLIASPSPQREEQPSYFRTNEPEKNYETNQYTLRPTRVYQEQQTPNLDYNETPRYMMEKPQLRQVDARAMQRQKSMDEEEKMKEEIARAAAHRTKKRRNRMNSGGITRRYCSGRRNSNLMLPGGRRRSMKIAKEDRGDDVVNRNFVTDEVQNAMSRLKKVKTKEPSQLSDVLSGMDLKHVTKGAITKEEEDPRWAARNNATQAPARQDEEHYTEDSWSDDSDDYSDPEELTRVRMLRRREEFTREKKSKAGKPQFNIRTGKYDVIDEQSVNASGVEETISRIWDNDPELTEVNLNNIQNVPMDMWEELAAAMEANTCVTSLNLANTNLQDRAARCLAKMLAKNRHLQKLNVESNYITGNGGLRIMANTRRCKTLQELRIDNQRHIFGARVEGEFVKLLRDNKSIIRFGYQFTNPGFRMSAANCLTKNMDDVRKKRVMEQRMKAGGNQNLMAHPGHNPRRADRYRQKKMNEQRKPELDVREVLGDIKPHEMELLQKWFAAKMAEEQGMKEPPRQQPYYNQQQLEEQQQRQQWMEQQQRQRMMEQQQMAEQQKRQQWIEQQQRQQMMEQQQQRQRMLEEQQRQQQLAEQQKRQQWMEQRIREQQQQQQMAEQQKRQQWMEQQQRQQMLEQQQRQQQMAHQQQQQVPPPPPVVIPPPPSISKQPEDKRKQQPQDTHSRAAPKHQPKDLREQLLTSIRNPKGRTYLNKVKRKSCLDWYLPEKKEVGQDDKKHMVGKTFIPSYQDVKAATKKFENTAPTPVKVQEPIKKPIQKKENPANVRESLLDAIKNTDARPKLKQVKRKSCLHLYLPEPTIEERSGVSSNDDDDKNKDKSTPYTPKTPTTPLTLKSRFQGVSPAQARAKVMRSFSQDSIKEDQNEASVEDESDEEEEQPDIRREPPSYQRTKPTYMYQKNKRSSASQKEESSESSSSDEDSDSEEAPSQRRYTSHTPSVPLSSNQNSRSSPVPERRNSERRLSSSYYVEPSRIRETHGHEGSEESEKRNSTQPSHDSCQSARRKADLHVNIPTRHETDNDEDAIRRATLHRRDSSQETPTYRSSIALHPSTPPTSSSSRTQIFPQNSRRPDPSPLTAPSTRSSSYQSSLSAPRTPSTPASSARARSIDASKPSESEDESEDEVLEYKEGQDYNSDEYEVVEVEVSDNEEEEEEEEEEASSDEESSSEEEAPPTGRKSDKENTSSSSSSSSSSDESGIGAKLPVRRYTRPYQPYLSRYYRRRQDSSSSSDSTSSED